MCTHACMHTMHVRLRHFCTMPSRFYKDGTTRVASEFLKQQSGGGLDDEVVSVTLGHNSSPVTPQTPTRTPPPPPTSCNRCPALTRDRARLQVNFSWDDDGHSFNIGLKGTLPLTLVLYCRVCALTEADTEGPGGGWTVDALGLAKILQSGRDVSSAHGRRWRELATVALQNQLETMPTSYGDDSAVLATLEAGGSPVGWEGPTDNLMQAVRFRMGHKKILLDAITSLASF